MELNAQQRADLVLKQTAAVQFLTRIALAETAFVNDREKEHFNESVNELQQEITSSDVNLGVLNNPVHRNSAVTDNVLNDTHLTRDVPSTAINEANQLDTGFVILQPDKLKNGSFLFEDTSAQKKSLAITLLTSSGAPLVMFSVLPFSDTQKAKAKKKSKQFNPYLEKLGLTLAIDAVKRKKAESYARCLEPALTLCPKTVENSIYNPFFLDDPELKIGRHKTVITLPFFLGSIIQPSKPADIKKELNEHFKETHPTVDATITLSQIRNLKAKLLEIGTIEGLELSSIAMSYVYFEKLILKNVVTKANRRLIGAISLLLAAKVNDPKELDYARLLGTVEKLLDIGPKDVLAGEFSVYAALEFSLFLPSWDILPHLERIMLQLGDSELGNAEGYLSHASPFYKELVREQTSATL